MKAKLKATAASTAVAMAGLRPPTRPAHTTGSTSARAGPARVRSPRSGISAAVKTTTLTAPERYPLTGSGNRRPESLIWTPSLRTRRSDGRPPPALGRIGRHGGDRGGRRLRSEGSEERAVGEVEDAAVGGDHEVAVAEADHADDGLVQRPPSHGPAEGCIAKREDAAVGRDQPVPAGCCGHE